MTKALRVTGTVKFFSGDRGYGFLIPDDGSDEVFVHRTDLNKSLNVLLTDQRVRFEIVDGKPAHTGNRKKAASVEVVSHPSPECTTIDPETLNRASQ